MRATIDGAGRIVIPKEIRRQPRRGAGVDVRWRGGLIEMEPARQAMRLVRDGPLLVAVADGDAAPLTTEQVEVIKDALRRERTDPERRRCPHPVASGRPKLLSDQGADVRLFPLVVAQRYDVTAVSRDHPAGAEVERVPEPAPDENGGCWLAPIWTPGCSWCADSFLAPESS